MAHNFILKEGDAVLFESYACIKHLLSGEWLHLEKKGESHFVM